MCGILLNIFRNSNGKIRSKKFRELICNRGPDSFNDIEDIIGNGWNSLILGSVLWTQGYKTGDQPIKDGSGSFLLWNGDVYHGVPNCGESCDSELVFAELVQHDVLSIISKICGPYAFIYYDAIKSTLWFGRDVVGRHSLLWNINSENLLLTSVCPRSADIEEVPNYGIFKIDLSNPVLELSFHPWSHLSEDRFKFSVKVGFSTGNKLSHASFISPYHYNWYSKEPERQEIEFLSGITPIKEAAIIFQQLALNLPLHTIIEKIKHLMFQSVEKRIKIKPDYCSNCISSLKICNHSKLAILFSGGLDSTILAAIANYVAPEDESIDLYNVAFERSGTKSDGFLVPDRKNGYESLKELSLLYPQRKWNFVEINVSQEELGKLRSQHIADLIHPLKSILDDSLGCALWFAARGKGVLDGQPYISPARIVLLGMGADEIFGGYSRHRKEFEKKRWSGLGLQLIEEVNNIGKRNLGRDNRIVTDHGRQPRLPYLDENLLEFALSLPPWHRCCLNSNMTAGIGDKILLRSLAWNLGLRYCSTLPKKALQFGSKIANPKEKGHELSENLVHI